MATSGKAIFLDRDGTLIEHVPYLHEPEKVKVVPGARESLVKALDAGFRLFLFTNQSGVGRGMFSMASVEACNHRMLELLALPDPGFCRICIAPEAPDEPVRYRKPSPRFIEEMIKEHQLDPSLCWMVGDNDVDIQAAANAGIQSMRVGEDMTLPQAISRILAKAMDGPH